MYLKKIRAFGFKSFADKIELDIDKGITGVVGPNGSGKSNIVDAVKWVLGEQSIKALRGDGGMTDVIFAGSKSRNASNRASVALVFDNSDHYLNTDLAELEIKRVVYRTGENDYYINNAKVRLKDIVDLFLDSGAGRESFNIISQGAVADVVNSKPIERRAIFEEAAGVLKYKKRKEESFRKLEKTKENLERVDLVIEELLNTLTPLKEQSENASKYLEYKDELSKIEISLIVNDIDSINTEYLTLKDDISSLTEEIEKLNLENNSLSNKIDKLKSDSLKMDLDIETKNDLILGIDKELLEIDSKKKMMLERSKYQVDAKKLEESMLVLQEDVLNLKNTIELLRDELNSKVQDKSTKELRSLELIKCIDNKKNEKNSLLKDINDTTRDIMNLNNRIDIIKDNISNDTKLPYSVKNVINNIRLKGICGVLGKLLEVPDKYVIALETSLGANMNVIVVESEQASKEAITYLKDNKLGRATFFPLNIIKPRNIMYEDLEKIRDVDGYIGTLDSLCKYDSKYANVVLNQLGNVIVADNIDTLNKIGRLINHKYKIVTLDGEISYPGGAITGGSIKQSNSVMKDKMMLSDLDKEVKNKEAKLDRLNKKLDLLSKDIIDTSNDLENNQRDVVMLTEEVNFDNDKLSSIMNDYNAKCEELDGVKSKSNNSIDKELDNIVNLYYEKENLKNKETKLLDKLKSDKSMLVNDIGSLEKDYKAKCSLINTKESLLKNKEIREGKLDVKLDSLLLNLSQDYELTYERAKDEYKLDIDSEVARITVNNLRSKINSLGEVNIGSIKEYERLNERYTFLTEQRSDLETSSTNLLEVISEMDEIMKDRFIDTFEKISKEFSVVFKKLFKGGDGILELTDKDDLLNTGIEISALPPGKKLNSIALLSGGEKTLTAIALLFAILNVKPVPFVILDEVEAALDEANVDSFGSYLVSCKDRSQFIIITHKKRTMEYADVLYGITMQESGVSKLVSVKLEG